MNHICVRKWPPARFCAVVWSTDHFPYFLTQFRFVQAGKERTVKKQLSYKNVHNPDAKLVSLLRRTTMNLSTSVTQPNNAAHVPCVRFAKFSNITNVCNFYILLVDYEYICSLRWVTLFLRLYARSQTIRSTIFPIWATLDLLLFVPFQLDKPKSINLNIHHAELCDLIRLNVTHERKQPLEDTNKSHFSLPARTHSSYAVMYALGALALVNEVGTPRYVRFLLEGQCRKLSCLTTNQAKWFPPTKTPHI